MVEKQKHVWLIIETSIEKMHILLKQEKNIPKSIRKIGRPKKTKEQKINQEEIFMKNFLRKNKPTENQDQDIIMRDETEQKNH